ncbi:VirB4 family type IV secretion/conjugal transfer ATPase [Cupriavidus necator]
MFTHPRNESIAQTEALVNEHIPFSVLIDEHTIRTREGDYLRTWKVDGISFEAVDQEEILIRHNNFNQLIRSFSEGNVSFWVHRVRRKISDSFDGDYSNEFCRKISVEYYRSFGNYSMMANELYITLVYRPSTEGIERFLKRSLRRNFDAMLADEREAVAGLVEAANRVEAGLRHYGLEALGEYTQGASRFSRLLEFFGFLLNGFWERVPLTRSPINEYLPTSRLFFGCENIEIRTPAYTRFGALLDIKDYPSASTPGILNRILYEDHEYIETQSFSTLNKHGAIAFLTLQRNQLLASQDAGVSQIEEIDHAIERIVAGDFIMGEYHYSLAVLGDSLKEVTKNLSKTRIAMQDAGFQTALIDVVPDGAWFAQLPGNWRYRPREAKITSKNFCGFSSLHNFASGKRDGNPWGQAVTILKTPNGQPFYFNFHTSPEEEVSTDKKLPANTMVIGQTGSGKTVLTLFLLCQAMKYNPTVVYFDKDRSAEVAIRAMGGEYLSLGYGEPTGLNPFHMEPTESTILFWESLVRHLVTHASMPLLPSEEQQIAHAVRTVAGMPKTLRRLSTVRQNLLHTGMNSLNARLKKWCWGESLGWVLDNPVDRLNTSGSNVYGYDYTDFLDDPETRTPLMMYLMARVEELIDGRRFIYLMSEFWKPLSDPVFSSFAKDKQKTIRKQNGFGVFDTQSPSDVLNSSIAKTLIEQTATFIFLPNPRADHSDYVEGFKLTEAEFAIIKNLQEGGRSFLVKQGSHSAIASLELGGMDEILNVLSGTTDNVALLERIRSEVGDDPKTWMPIFQRQVSMRQRSGEQPRVPAHEDVKGN